MNWNAIKTEYETTKITLKALAEKHDVKLGTLKSRKSREKWSRDAPKKDATKTKKVATPKEKVATKKTQKNRSGNPNPKNQFTKRNSAAVTHGLFAKYLPEETMEIMNDVNSMSPIDILWMNIQMQFASIIRAQQIMFVDDKYDMTKEVKKRETATSEAMEIEKEEWEIQFAWDKQATFMNSLSRSMAELRSMLKQFVEMADYDDYRLLEIQKMQLTIDKTKAEITKIKGEDDIEYEDDGFMEALGGTAEEVWGDE
ncbi:phage terminase small subunit [Gracilibacillus oryzae]|uniref:phage terminase small subunit n=1 Tax=Gracilibacillus oryzae TaxID=1672701 RepID=UPI001D17D748|nr:phage terminase small subunit [Gracilibacillus oryzae]